MGAKLIYPNHTIQHAGVVVGLGQIAGHIFKGYPNNTKGYFNRLQIVQNVAVVTGACLMLTREAFAAVGGFDEGYHLTFGDIDLCLKLYTNNYWNVWTPLVNLYHHESITRGPEDSPSKLARFKSEVGLFQKNGGIFEKRGPLFNPNFRLDSHHCALKIQ